MELKGNCFTFTWKLENISFCLEKKNHGIVSPNFVVDSIDDMHWYLMLYPREENYVAFYLCRYSCVEEDIDSVSISCELAFIAENSSVETLSKKLDFYNNDNFGFDDFVKREELFVTKRSVFLPNDTLTARCRIWEYCDEKMTGNVRCFARTRIGVEKRSFIGNVKNFSTLECGKQYTYEIKSLNRLKRLMSLNLSLTEGLSAEEIICVKLNLHDRTIKFSTLLLSLIDITGKRIECNRDEFWFDDESNTKEFKFFFTKNKLMLMKTSYLPDDILSLHWEWAFSKGIVSNEMEEAQYARTSTENEFFNSQKINRKMVPLSYPLNDNLKSLYDENFLCDVQLQTSTRVFNVHKVILSASSSVFKAMFSNDMKEKHSNCVNIEDLSDDIISRMLDYIYTARIDDLTWNNSSLLYAAADKYAIFNLKNLCSSFLKDHLSPANACGVLLLSEFHADGDLKSDVQDYILENVKDTVNSDGWKILMETNAILAAETLSRPYIQNREV